jgi:hypothetical protein
VLRYLKGTSKKGICMKNNDSNAIYGYSDADWAEIFDRTSIIGFCTFIGGNLDT